MVIAPDNEIVLLEVPLEIDNKNQLTFTNANKQFEYFRYITNQHQYDHITYVSTDTSVATVAPKDATYGTCTITKVAAGSCQIIATSGSQVATLPVTVS